MARVGLHCNERYYKNWKELGTQSRQSTLLLNEGIPRALKGKKLRLKNILLLPSESEGIYLQILMESTCKK